MQRSNEQAVDSYSGDMGSSDKLPFSAEWTLPNGFSSADYGVSSPVPLPSDIGWERLEFQDLGEGSGIFDYRGMLHSSVTVKGSVLSDQPYLTIRLITEGSANVSISGKLDRNESTETYSLTMHPGREDATIKNKPGEPHSLIVPILSIERLRTMLDGQKAPAPFQRILNGQAENLFAQPKLSPTLSRIVGEIRTSPYHGVMRSLYLQGKIFEMMAEVLSDLSDNNKTVSRMHSADCRRAHMARDILMAELANPPKTDDLARRVGLSQKRLGEVFHDLYGASVFQCLAQWRLDRSRELLLDGELAIKQIAHAMGYSHPNNFILAFSRHFGTPPARYRKENSTH